MVQRASIVGASLLAALLAGLLAQPSARPGEEPELVKRVGRLRFLSAHIDARVDELALEASVRSDVRQDVREARELIHALPACSARVGVDLRLVRERLAEAGRAWEVLLATAEHAIEAAPGAERFHAAAARALHGISDRLRTGPTGPALDAAAADLAAIGRCGAEPSDGPGARGAYLELDGVRRLRATLGEGDRALAEDLLAVESTEALHGRLNELRLATRRQAAVAYQASERLVASVADALTEKALARARATQALAVVAAGACALVLAHLVVRALGRTARLVEHQTRALENVVEAVVLTDRTGKIVYANPAFSAITGYPLSEAVGRSPSILKSGVHDSTFYERLWGTILAGRTWTGRIVNRRRDGTIFETDQTIARVLDARGETSGFVSVFRDATGEPQAERLRALGLLVAEVAHEVNNPAHVMALGATFMTEALADVKKALTACPAHDRCPMGAAAKGPIFEELPQTVSDMAMAATRVSDFVGELRHFASPDPRAGTWFSVADVVTSAIKLLRLELGPRGVTLDADLSRLDGRQVFGHPLRLEQVFVNLLKNALEAAPSAGGTIRVLGAATPEGLEVSVEDNGPGVPPELVPRLFEPFATTRRTEGGTGLGLALCARIVTELGGRIAHERREAGGGARFKVTLPASRQVGSRSPDGSRESPAAALAAAGAAAEIGAQRK